MRAVQTLAGVGGSDDYRSDFSIRAAPFDHLSVTLDGIPSSLLVHTVHRARDTGSLAMLNSDILEGASVLFGSYPQRYGNRTGSQVDFRMREGSRARQQYRVAVSAIAASAVAEGPLGRARRGSWLVTGRKSYIDWLIHRIDPETTGTFGFVDAQAKAVYDLSPRHTVTGTLVAGRSRWDEGDGRGGLNFLEIGLNNAVMSAATLRSSVGKAAVLTQQVYGVFNRYRNENPSTQPLTVGSERDLSYRATVVVPGPRGSTIESGVHLQWLGGSLEESPLPGERSARLGQRHRTAHAPGRLPVHAAAAAPRADDLRRASGSIASARSDETLASPWLQAELGLPGRFLIAGGGGLYRQSPDLLQAANPFGDPVHAERARHLDLGIGQEIGVWRWQATVFDRDEDDMIFFENQEDRLIDGEPSGPLGPPLYANALDGSVRGVELTLTRRVPNGLSGWIGYAYADSNYTHRDHRRDVAVRRRAAPQPDGVWQLPAERSDQRVGAVPRRDQRADRRLLPAHRRSRRARRRAQPGAHLRLRAPRPARQPHLRRAARAGDAVRRGAQRHRPPQPARARAAVLPALGHRPRTDGGPAAADPVRRIALRVLNVAGSALSAAGLLTTIPVADIHVTGIWRR